MPFTTIDLCAGIGGMRKGFELTGYFHNVLAAEIDKYACMTYQHLYGDDANHDLTSEEFKAELDTIQYDVLLAGFPCQTFSKAGLEEGFNDTEKGIIFNHIAEIIRRTRPRAVFLENVDNLVRHDKGNTFRVIINTLEKTLNYKVIGVTYDMLGEPTYNGKDFIRNSRNFGIPQNRPRTYIMAFDRQRYGADALAGIENCLPIENDLYLYDDLNELLEFQAEAKYYMASGYLDTLIRHREREHGRGKQYFLVFKPDNQKNSFEIQNQNIVFSMSAKSTVKQRDAYIKEEYRKILKEEIEKRLPKWEAQTGLKCDSWQTKYMVTKWGACSTDKKKLWFNLKLAQKPYACLDYIILHELMHLLTRKHDATFIAHMDRHMPN